MRFAVIGYQFCTVSQFLINDLQENANSLLMTFADNTANYNEESQSLKWHDPNLWQHAK